MSPSFAELVSQNKEMIVRELAQMVKERAGPTYAAVPLEQLLPRMQVVFDALYGAIAKEDPAIMEEFTAASVRQRVQERYAMEEIQTLISILHDIVLRLVDAAYREEPEQWRNSIWLLEELAHRSRQRAFQVYIEAYEELAELQRRTLAEISTPVIRVYENVLVLPLVGAIDTERAHRIMEELLQGITRHQAEMVIIDITGVPLVDTAVANHLMQTIKAARLLGTRSILVGISSEVAQALVHLQIDLTGVVTRSNLQAGIEYALEQMGLGIAPAGIDLSAEEHEAPSAGAY
jgi:rsbT co-antagonist protein RsbR